MNKKGYIRVLEAGIAIIILLGFIFFFSMPTFVHRTDLDKEVYKSLDSVLDEIGRKSELRDYVFAENDEELTVRVNDMLKKKSLQGKVVTCDIEENCLPDEVQLGKDIYVRERIIAIKGDIKKVAIHAWTTY